MELSKMNVIKAIKHAGGVAMVAMTLTVVVNAQQPSAASMSTARELITITGATALFSPLIAGVVEQAKVLFLQQDPSLGKDLNDISGKIRTDLQPRFTELTDEVARLYATNFTEQELKEVLAFYKTPSGKKLLNEQPKIVDSSMKFAQDWANKLSDQVIAKMREELKKRGHAL